MHRHRPNDHGFTLVEILIAIVLVGILSAVVVVGVGNLTSSGASASCATSADAVRTAATSHLTLAGSAPTSFSQMVTSGALSLGSGVAVGSTGLTLEGSGWTMIWYGASGPVPRLECTSGSLGAPGLGAQVYGATNFTNPVSTFAFTTSASTNWGMGGPLASLVDNFSIRYTGNITVPTSGVWTFTGSVDDALNVWLNDQLLINAPSAGTVVSRQVTLAAGTYPIRIDYVEATSGASWALTWTPPGGTATTIPASAFTVTPLPAVTGSIRPPTLSLASTTATAAAFTIAPTPGTPVLDGVGSNVLTCTAPGQPTRTSTTTLWLVAVDGLTTGATYSCTASLQGSAASTPVVITPTAPPAGPGLSAVVYASTNFTNPVSLSPHTTSATVNWGYGGPSPWLIDGFGVRYSGTITIPTTGTWTFGATVDDVLNVRINGQPVVTNNVGSSVTLNAGTYPISIDYVENSSPAYWTLTWTPPGGSAVSIPANAFATG